ncbi:MAG: transcription-repair coupling factor [Burkholderiaceae bacterium]|nr:transcription-repair coupling factor [Burkholderiaceae bacterium]
MSDAVNPAAAPRPAALLTPPIPVLRAGQRFTFKQLVGSSDAALIAQTASAHRNHYSQMAVLCASALDAQRLLEEIPTFAPQLRIRLLPDWEILPYDHFSPHQDLISERLATLYEMQNGSCDLILLPVTTALQRLAPPAFLSAHTFFFKQGEHLNEEALRLQLQQAGYDPVSAVMRPGEYSIRGGLIDLFPMGSSLPYRLDLFGDEIEQIRAFDPDTQRSLYPVKEIRLLPGHEFPFDEGSRTAFRGRWREYFEGDPTRCSIYKDVSSGIPTAGIESYLPLFFDETATIFDYFMRSESAASDSVCLVYVGDIESSITQFWKDTEQRYAFLKHDPERPVMNPSDLFLGLDQFFIHAKSHPRIVLQVGPEEGAKKDLDESLIFSSLPDVSVHRRDADPLKLIRQLLSQNIWRVIICAESAGRSESIRQLMEESNLGESSDSASLFPLHPSSADSVAEFLKGSERFSLCISPLFNGFTWHAHGVLIITESELFTQTARQRRGKETSNTDPDMLFKDLSELKVGDPVVHVEHGIGRYQGLVLLNMATSKEAPAFEEFLHLVYAQGATLYVPVQQLHQVTRYAGADPDSAPLHQLGSGQWDKAKRKAAQQIRDTAAELLNLYAARARIVELSRFKTTKEINAALASIASGEADIVIGTHKLLSKETKFERLGLVIVDEEHRFGVRQKDALKAMRAEVDILTLTATPIPRTLGMALEGLREFSVIATAPQKRLAIKTFVRREGDGVIREAVLREIKRGGQVYFLHNEVETIQNRKQALQTLLPEARIAVAHGQMNERELESVMRDFVTQRSNLLLCTTIIETGIDVPTANTIIMHRADKFGLAQLHQLRGRVGRSHHQAYAYLLVPDPEALSKQAHLRLDAIQAMEELGSGFYLAMHDLEIRGAGEVLGDKQSGDIHEIGFQLYTEMLNRAVKSLRSGKEPDLLSPMQATTDVSLGAPALLPADYCPDVHERLSLYKRFASCEDFTDLSFLREELIDRFGNLPDAAKAFYETHRLRLEMSLLGIKKIDASTTAIQLQFIPQPPLDPVKIIRIVQSNPAIHLNGQDRIKYLPPKDASFEKLEQRIEGIRQLMKLLSSALVASAQALPTPALSA